MISFGGGILLYLICWTLPMCSMVNLPDKDDIFDQYPDLVKVGYKDAIKSILVFHHSNTIDYRPLIADKIRREIIVGARDVVLRLDAHDLSMVEKFDWPASAVDVEMCQMKGQNDVDCHNFVRTLALRDDKILICGTNAFRPACTWRRVTDLRMKLQEQFDGVGYAPFNPKYNGTYVMTQEGHLFTGVVTDFAGHDPTLLRLIPANRILRTAKANNRWLNDPSFVSAFESGQFVYFFFREPAVEASNCGKFVYSRVARVCKNDVGGDIILQDHWTTFSKARLNCSLSGNGENFGYDHLQSVHFSSRQNVIFATFTTADGSVPGSAICAYNMTSLQKAFSGPYRHQSGSSSFWTSEPNRDPNFDCDIQGVSSSRPGLTRRQLVEAQKYQLMNDAVQPNSGIPLHSTLLERYKFVAVDLVSTKNNGEMNVLFVLTDDGLVKKFVLPSAASSEACLIEVIQLSSFDETLNFASMELFKEMGALYVATSKRMIKIPLQRCSRHSTKRRCLESRDPYCGWNEASEHCTGSNGLNHNWIQSLDGCPSNNAAVDGHFGEWSTWSNCPQYDTTGDSCLCRGRSCDSPRPKLGGKQCSGPIVQVANCTQHGAWTSWTDWSACSQTCGSAIRTRKRYCSSPPPAYGGRICLGLDTQQEFCLSSDCPVPMPSPIHGGWSDWSSWDSCSKPCNGGFHKRTRSCNNPTPQYEGSHCYGCSIEYKTCNEELCNEARRWSDWTPWLQSNATASGGVWLKRHRFVCQARVDDPSYLSVSTSRSEEKLCSKSSENCEHSLFLAVDGGWSHWSSWTSCSALCGNGSQSRGRQCNNPTPSGNGLPCSNHAKEVRQCNAHSCEGSWSCWSEYSDCSVTCGAGYRHRQRQCLHINGHSPCKGDRSETTVCDAGPCTHDGYGEWTGWSSCNKLGVHVRIRPCISLSFCNGKPDAQMAQCHKINEKTNEIGALYQASQGSSSSSSNTILIPCVIGAFVGGILLTALIFCYIIRRRSNCCFSLAAVKKPACAPNSLFAVHPPMTPTIAKSSNIYTPPPSLRNIHPAPNVTMNPMNSFNNVENDYDGLSDQETTLTLKRNMRTSLNNRDYL